MARVIDPEKRPENFFTGPKGHPIDRILIHESEKIPKEGQFIGLNGYQYLIKPGHEVDIPRPVRKMLDTRIETQTFQGEDGKDYHKHISRLNYTLIKEDVNNPMVEELQANTPQAEARAEGG